MNDHSPSYSGKRVIEPAPHTRRRRKHNPILPVLALLFGAAFLLSAAMVIRYYVRGNAEEAAFTKLASMIAQSETPTEATLPAESPDVSAASPPSVAAGSEPVSESPSTMQPGYDTLYAMNSDFIGWLSVSGTKIDYPVMLTPDDPQYYLRRAFDKTSSDSGTPFIGLNGTPDTDCFIIYGHNMKNKTMFGTLSRYQEQSFWDTVPTFSFNTLYENRTYEVFAALECRILDEDEVGLRYYEYSGDLTEEEYAELTQWLLDNAAYDTGIIPSYGDQILILSTCSYHTDNGRFIVAARRIS